MFEWAINDALARYDPLIKAERAKEKQSVTQDAGPTGNKRKHIPQHILNQLNLRDERRYSFQKHGRRCNHRRFLDIHHIKPVKDGGQNMVENLATLCEMQHVYLHSQEEIDKFLALIRRLCLEQGIRC